MAKELEKARGWISILQGEVDWAIRIYLSEKLYHPSIVRSFCSFILYRFPSSCALNRLSS